MGRPYAIHNASECDRLERQAALAGLEDHLGRIPLPTHGRILDAGCGSGSMTRLLAHRAPAADVIGVDLRPDYIEYAANRAQNEVLSNITFRAADACHLPWPNRSFDLIWSKYLLQWLDKPEAAIAEFFRVLNPGGTLVCCNFDGFAVTHFPIDPELQGRCDQVFGGLVDPFVGRKMAPMSFVAGFTEISVQIEADRLYTIVGAIDRDRRRNWEEQLNAAQPHISSILGTEAAAADFIRDFLTFQDRPETCSYTTLYFVRGRRPA